MGFKVTRKQAVVVGLMLQSGQAIRKVKFEGDFYKDIPKAIEIKPEDL